MKKFLLFLVLYGLLAAACSKKNDDDPQPDSLEYFTANLQAGMKYDALLNKFGQPDNDIGSGLHIYVYQLNDGSSVYIGFTDTLMYARHVNSSGQVLHNII